MPLKRGVSQKTISQSDAAYAAGLFNGEGCTAHRTCQSKGGYAGKKYLVLRMGQSDSQVLDDMRRIFGGSICGPYRRPVAEWVVTRKPFWQWDLSGFEAIQWAVIQMWPRLSREKRLQYREKLHAVTQGF